MGKISSLKGLSREMLNHHPWRDLKAGWMWHLGTWVNGGLGSAGGQGTVGLDLKGLSK